MIFRECGERVREPTLSKTSILCPSRRALTTKEQGDKNGQHNRITLTACCDYGIRFDGLETVITFPGTTPVPVATANTVTPHVIGGINASGTVGNLVESAHIGEVIWFNKQLTPSECTQVETYLSEKWAL